MADSLIETSTLTRDNLIAGDNQRLISKSVTLASGNLTKGTLLGKITKSTPTTGTAGTNTGNGTCTSVAAGLLAKLGAYVLTCISKTGGTLTVPTTGTKTGTGNGTCTSVTGGALVKAGSYILTCITAADSPAKSVFAVRDPDGYALPNATESVAYVNSQINFTITEGVTPFIVGDYFTITATDGGLFSVRDPEGNKLPDAQIGVAYSNPQINFLLNDGSTDFIVGDSFTITVAAGSGQYKQAVATAVDGSQDLETAAILAEDKDASSEAKTVVVYVAGEFNQNEMTFGSGFSASSVKDKLEQKGIYLKDSLQN